MKAPVIICIKGTCPHPSECFERRELCAVEGAEDWCRGCEGVGCKDCCNTGAYSPKGQDDGE